MDEQPRCALAIDGDCQSQSGTAFDDAGRRSADLPGDQEKFEPLLLLPIGFGAILSNIPVAGIAGPEGLLGYIYQVGIETGVFPLLIFMGVGALTDFGALIAMPMTLFLGAAAQFGIFITLIGALALNVIPGFGFSLSDASAIAIIGSADGPTAIFLASKLAPDLLGQ